MRRKIGKLAVLCAAALTLALFAGPARANAVTLECVQQQVPPQPHVHSLTVIDFDAGTVRLHAIDDDGAPAMINGMPSHDSTNPAQISDNIITWTDPIPDGAVYYSLGRYSGIETAHSHFTGNSGTVYDYTVSFSCHPWTPPKLQKQF
jgi:hypothetical protein